MADSVFLNPPAIAAPTGYTHVVVTRAARTIYISGQVALDRSGAIVGRGDMRAQAEQVFVNLREALARYLDMARPPASTAVEVRRLAREEFLIEIEAVAVTA